MPIFRPSELHKLLTELNKKASKGLSQNFLIDGNIVSNLINAASIEEGDVVLEIGPGPGAVSEAILERDAKLIAVEKDKVFAKAIEKLEGLEVFCDDILKFPIESTIKPLLKDKKAKVVASLPYNIATAILTKLIMMSDTFSTLTVIVQHEVAKRFVAKPKTKDYSSLTLFLNFYSDPKYNFKIGPNCFYPRPKVNSAAVTFTLKKPPKVNNVDKFFQLTRFAFQQRRKMLRASLKELYPTENVIKALENIGLSANARPEELSLNQFMKFHEHLSS